MIIPYNKLMKNLRVLIRRVLAQYPDIKLCIVFGSVAAGNSSDHSDLDIAIAADQPISTDKYLELIEQFSSATSRDIDLIDLMTATGPILRQALSRGQIVQNHDKSLYARLISRMLFNQADMMPYHERILRERRERFINE